jgi:oxygen-independent coproporphyrinogen-3 oxidase
MISSSSASLYLHIPFCISKCDYCDFYSIPVRKSDERTERFIPALLNDAAEQMRRFRIRKVPTVYIGGGTPSVLGADGIMRLLDGLFRLLPGMPEELTVEVNPESADREFLEACKSRGVTRISMGVQTFCEVARDAVRRQGKPDAERLEIAADIFSGNFSVDIISGLPFQNEDGLIGDLEKTFLFKPAHISLYALTIEEDTPLGKRIIMQRKFRKKNEVITGGPCSNSKIILPDKDEADALWIRGRDFLDSSGFDQYEISNFSLPGKRSRHNIRYWRMENWLGAGPSASGTLISDETGRGIRLTCRADIERYILFYEAKDRGEPPYIKETLDRDTLIKEHFLMGFRYREGPDEKLFTKRFGRRIADLIPETLEKWRSGGLFEKEKTALNRSGLLLLNSFLVDCFRELEKN